MFGRIISRIFACLSLTILLSVLLPQSLFAQTPSYPPPEGIRADYTEGADSITFSWEHIPEIALIRRSGICEYISVRYQKITGSGSDNDSPFASEFESCFEGTVDVENLEAGTYNFWFRRVWIGEVCRTNRNGRESCDDDEISSELTEPLTIEINPFVFRGTGFENGWGGFENDDQGSFIINTGSTPSNGTGPSSGANGTSGYVYLETSRGDAFEAGDSSEFFQEINGATSVSFYYHMYGSDMGELSVRFFSRGGKNGRVNKTIWSISGQQHTSSSAEWTKVTLDLRDYLGDEQEITFIGRAVGGFRGDMAIDQISTSSATPTPLKSTIADIDRTQYKTSYSNNHDDAVGELQGDFSVNSSGAATYNIPIMLPKGVNEATPSLSLNYNSNGGNGLLGKGWSLDGTSSITRCGQDYLRDGQITGIQFNNEDRFCLNGSRLILTSGSYGGVNAEYATEIESNNIIRSVGGSNGHPSYFTLTATDGSVSTYGGSTDAKQSNGDGDTYKWAISNKADIGDNNISYSYTNNTNAGTFKLNRINYSVYSVQFNYITQNHSNAREDIQTRMMTGYQYITEDLLESITVKNGASTLREYNLEYKSIDTINRTSKIEAIQECSATACFPKTQFDWADDNFDIGSDLSSQGEFDDIVQIKGASTGDFNGDGISDLILRLDDDEGNNECIYRYFLGSPNGLKRSGDTTADSFGCARVDGSFFKSINVNDFNGDGRSDTSKLLSYSNNGNWDIPTQPINNILSYNTARQERRQFDVNRDGIPDKVIQSGYLETTVIPGYSSVDITFGKLNTSGTNATGYIWDDSDKITLNLPIGYAPHSFKDELTSTSHYYTDVGIGFYDVTGDGALELVINGVSSRRLKNARNPSLGYDYIRGPYHAFDLPDDLDNAHNTTLNLLIDEFAHEDSMFADINGDGITDAFHKRVEFDNDDDFDYTSLFFKITGIDDEFKEVFEGDNRFDFTTTEISLIDYDKDGKLDIYAPGEPILLWRDGQFEPLDINAPGRGSQSSIAYYVQDFTGDGLLDVVVLENRAQSFQPGVSTGGYYRGASFYTGTQMTELEGRIKTITTGTGYQTDINYEQLALSSHYKPFDINADGPDEIQDSLCIYLSYSHCAERYNSGAYNGDSFYERLAQGPLLPEANSDSLHEELAYKPVTGDRPIVASVTSTNPHTRYSSAGNVNENGKKTIDYYYGRAFTNGYRGGVGFETMSMVDNDAELETQSVYRQDFPFTGRVTLQQVRTTYGMVLSTTYTDWGMNISEQRDNDIYQLYPKKVVVANHDPETGDLLKVMETGSSINADGHIKESTEETKTASGALVKSVTNYISYDGSSAVCNARGLPSFQSVESYLDESGDSKTLETAFTYNNNCQLASQTVEPNRAKFTSTMSYEYDDFGNASEVTVSAPSLASRTTKMVYDSTGRYVRLEYNAKNQLVQNVASVNSYGQPTRIIGLNGNRSTMVYDSFGRELYQSTDDGHWSANHMQWCGGINGGYASCPSDAIIRSEQTSATGAVSYQYTNVIGQVIRTSELGFDGNRYSMVDSEYDNKGQLRLQSLPYYEGDTTYWTLMSYDIINRETLTRSPDGSESTMRYDGFITTYTNDLNQTKTKTVNAIGELIQVEDHQSGKVVNTYTPLGNLATATSLGSNSDSHNIKVSMNYDHLGRKESMNDPDKGAWQYEYNAYGELMSNTNAKGEKTLNTYDTLGRMEKRVDYQNGRVANTTRWYYDGSTATGAPIRTGSAVNLLSAVVHSKGTSTACNTSQTEYCQSFSYDSYGRLISETKALGARGNHGSYTTRMEYDSVGRVIAIYDAFSQINANAGTYYHFNQYGYPSGISNISGNTYEGVYLLRSMNASGQVTSSERGNSVTTNYTYNPETTRIEQQLANGTGAYPVQDISYEWDTIGNLSSRANYSGRSVASHGYDTPELEETFCYDSLNRLTAVTEGLNSSCSVTSQVRYNSIGNITYKEGVGNYTYGQSGAGPHAVTRTSNGNIDYNYDANGNLTSDDEGRSIEYTVFDKPNVIYKDGHITQFYYGPDRARWKRVDIDKDSNTTTTLYLGSVEKVMKNNDNGTTKITWERYLSDFALYSATTSNNTVTNLSRKYLYKDYQGSVDVITDEQANVITLMSFDAWGKRRNGYEGKPFDTEEELVYAINQQLGQSVKLFSITNKGYTGHEMLDEVGLIHMNGRVYNPNIARFVSADPLISRPDDTQSYNRYSYVSNRSMFYTDPSGFAEEGCNDSDCDDGKIDDGCGGSVCDVVQSSGTSGNGIARAKEKSSASQNPKAMNTVGGESSQDSDTGASNNPGEAETSQSDNTKVVDPKMTEETTENELSALDVAKEAASYLPGAEVVGCAINGCSKTEVAIAVLSIFPAVKLANKLFKGVKKFTAARRLANKVQPLPASQRPSVVAVIKHKDGTITVGRNQGGVKNAEVQSALDKAPSNCFGGECAEINALSRARNKGRSLDGAIIDVRNVRGSGSKGTLHGTVKDACTTCKNVLKQFGVKGP